MGNCATTDSRYQQNHKTIAPITQGWGGDLHAQRQYKNDDVDYNAPPPAGSIAPSTVVSSASLQPYKSHDNDAASPASPTRNTFVTPVESKLTPVLHRRTSTNTPKAALRVSTKDDVTPLIQPNDSNSSDTSKLYNETKTPNPFKNNSVDAPARHHRLSSVGSSAPLKSTHDENLQSRDDALRNQVQYEQRLYVNEHRKQQSLDDPAFKGDKGLHVRRASTTAGGSGAQPPGVKRQSTLIRQHTRTGSVSILAVDHAQPRGSVSNDVALALLPPATTPAADGIRKYSFAAGSVQHTKEPELEHPKTSRAHKARASSASPTHINSNNLQTQHDDTTLLLSVPFFEELDFKGMRKLQKVFNRRMYKEGDYIKHATKPSLDEDGVMSYKGSNPKAQANQFRLNTHDGAGNPGETDDDFFLLISGTVEISMPNGKEVDAEEVVLTSLAAGSWFGSTGLMDDVIVNTVTIRCLEPVFIMSIKNEDFQGLVAAQTEDNTKTNQSLSTSVVDTLSNTRVALRSLPFFTHVDEIKLQQLSHLLELKRYNNEEYIIKEGEAGDGMFIIVRGSADVLCNMTDGSMKVVDVMSEMSWFGELCLLYSMPRTATIKCTSDKSILLYLSRPSFQLFSALAPEIYAQAYEQIQQSRTTRILRVLPLFDAVTRADDRFPSSPLEHLVESDSESKLRLLASLFKWQKMKANDVVFQEGDDAEKMYIIISGVCDVTARTPTGGNSKLRTLGAQEYFGEMGLLHSNIRSATVTCKTDCTFLTLTSQSFTSFLEVAPELQSSLERMVSQRTLNIIAALPIFSENLKENKPFNKLELLGELCSFEKHEAGDIVCTSAAPSQKFYCIVGGAVTVKTYIKETKVVRVSLLQRGGSFNEHIIIQSAPEVLHAVANERTVLMTLTAEKFQRFLQVAPELKSIFIVQSVIPKSPRNSHGADDAIPGAMGDGVNSSKSKSAMSEQAERSRKIDEFGASTNRRNGARMSVSQHIDAMAAHRSSTFQKQQQQQQLSRKASKSNDNSPANMARMLNTPTNHSKSHTTG